MPAKWFLSLSFVLVLVRTSAQQDSILSLTRPPALKDSILSAPKPPAQKDSIISAPKPPAHQDSIVSAPKPPAHQDSLRTSPDLKPSVPAVIFPTVLIGYGFAALGWQPLITFDEKVRQKVWLDNPHSTVKVDNYLQYAPAAAVYLLNAVGVKGWHGFRDRTVIYLTANLFLAIPVFTLKSTIHAPRPDGSGNDGFPSGHTATAFAAAEFMRLEYRDRSVWYGIAAYAAATGTAYLRVYNDKHWFSEILTGAGIGMLAAKASYWVFPFIYKNILRHPAHKIEW